MSSTADGARTVTPSRKSLLSPFRAAGRLLSRGWRRLSGRSRPAEDQSLFPLVIQVLVFRSSKVRGEADAGAVKRLPEEARMITVKTRKAR